jgi:SAM-dependent methyltransferase
MQHIYHEPQFGENWFTYPHLYRYFVQKLSDGGKIVEVGCWKGKSVAFLAVEIINSGKKIKVDAVDTWQGTPDEEYHQNDTYVKTDKLYQLFLSNISPVSSVVTPIRKTSVEAAADYADNSLDVVFIDAGHTYNDVMADISAWLPKVKSKGWLAGHDYASSEVKRAVDESIGSVDQSEGCWIYPKP